MLRAQLQVRCPHPRFPASGSHPSQLLGYIKKDKQGDSLIEKLCQRFAATEEPAQWHSIAFCLTQVGAPGGCGGRVASCKGCAVHNSGSKMSQTPGLPGCPVQQP